MSNSELWTYVSYGLAVIFFLIAMGFTAMMVISSQNSKSNPIALPKSQKPVEEEKEFFDIAENDASLKSALPGGRRAKVAPVMHSPKGNLKTSSIFDEDDETFKIAGGKD